MSDCCNKKRKVKLGILAAVLIVGAVGAVKCPWMNKQLTTAVQKVKQLNPLK